MFVKHIDVCGWQHDKITNSLFYQLTNRSKKLLYSNLTAALVVSEGNSFGKLWKNQNTSQKSMIIIPFNPNNYHWILVVFSIEERTTAIMDALVKNNMWVDASVHKVCVGYNEIEI